MYLKNDSIIIIPQGGEGGLFFDVEPITIIQSNEPIPIDILIESFKVSSENKMIPDLKKYKSPILKKMKINSMKKLYENSSYCLIVKENSRYALVESELAPDKKGFVLDKEIIIESIDDLPKAIIKTLVKPRKSQK